MYTQLSATQQAALENQTCPHCRTQGQMRKQWTRNGETVVCDSCNKRVYRPRGRGAKSAGQGSGNYTGSVKSDGGTTDGGQGQGQETGQSQGNAAQKASAAIGKPLSQAAQDALSKMEQALTESVKQAMQRMEQKAQREIEQKKQEIEATLEQVVEEKVESLKPTEVVVKQQASDGTMTELATVPGAHKMLAEILRRYSAGIRNFLFVGPSGSGKSTLARQLADALKVPYGMLPWSGDTTPGTVLGRPSPDGSTFNPSPWMLLYTTPSVFNHDELDGADPNVPICMNSAIENDAVYLPSGIFKRHPEHVVIATANTWGIGADMLYCGRNQLDAAVRDRYVGGMFTIDYDADLERQLVPEDDFRQAFWEIRARVFEHKLRRVWGTRALIRGAKLFRNGYSAPETFKALTEGWTRDELAKVGIAA